MLRVVLVALHVGCCVAYESVGPEGVEWEDCAEDHEDCSHKAKCCGAGKQCYKKDNWWAGCRSECTPGLYDLEPLKWRTPWSCTHVGAHHPDCAAQGVPCAHLGCCKDPGYRCTEKDEHWSQCLQSCEPLPGDSWTCKIISSQDTVQQPAQPPLAAPAPPPAPAAHGSPSPPVGLPYSGLTGSHFWDCNGGSCDAATLQPWNPLEYKYAPHYAPVDPADHGGAKYGEKVWMTGAFSDEASSLLGGDKEGCGHDEEGGGGCGGCFLVRTSDAQHPDWTAIVMKKNRCPGSNGACARPKYHLDFAVPGFDCLEWSLSNACGSSEKSNTFHTKAQSGTCGSSHHPFECNCNLLPTSTAEQRFMKKGCEVFKRWGWTHGQPTLDFEVVECPKAYTEWIKQGNSFDSQGVIAMYDNSTKLEVQGDDAALPGQTESGQMQWMLQRVALPFALLGGVLLAALRVWSSKKPRLPDDSEELLELQPAQ